MRRNNRPSQRNRLDFVVDGTKRGDTMRWSPLEPEYVTDLEDNPEGFDQGPIEVRRRLPGVRAALTLSGCPFEFIVRVVLDRRGNPQVVDLRMHSPHSLGDVPITNADLKAVSVAALATAARHPQIPGIEVLHDDEPEAQVVRGPGRPKRLTDEFLRLVTQFAREAHRRRYPINGYIAYGLADRVGYTADSETVRNWRKAATARRRQSPDDSSFLRAGELRGQQDKTEGTEK